MKDSYSFDRDEAGLDVQFQAHQGAYARIFERCGVKAYDVEAEPGMMGGSESRDFLAPAAAGENVIVFCENGDFCGPDIEVARTIPESRCPSPAARLTRLRRSQHPASGRLRDLRTFFASIRVQPRRRCRTRHSRVRSSSSLIRGDDRLEEKQKLICTAFRVSLSSRRPMSRSRRRSACPAAQAWSVPVGFRIGRVIADSAPQNGHIRRCQRKPRRLPPPGRSGGP